MDCQVPRPPGPVKGPTDDYQRRIRGEEEGTETSVNVSLANNATTTDGTTTTPSNDAVNDEMPTPRLAILCDSP
ncbi:hypothetical protein N7516_007686 [Penicillium verrucosum]|uniref:uncharacterized protein n=1 Tax=Penicillium verrucosum TaxID=60171 RepID=UPI0025454D3D|nr:uncharacterized protein N7516_007686 [Penicillium verrucosum]KAJ5933197.1 hypothetical protein N7516_007686 [Penicillium verrucosum]